MWHKGKSHFHLTSIFVEINFLDFYSNMMLTTKSMSICNDQVNYDDVTVQISLVFNYMF